MQLHRSGALVGSISLSLGKDQKKNKGRSVGSIFCAKCNKLGREVGGGGVEMEYVEGVEGRGSRS